ncbi:DUF6193 family natural product biosynthesis protein [Streptomyces sp. NPDC086549]|uniref:DUF6193 family natural product biosynthesis protein n=1 Tax=Streptomyces sp. NPDC086549 TaxID=3365752 RepID=UPI00382D21D3
MALGARARARGHYGGEKLFTLAAAAHGQPRIRALHPFPTHGTPKFLRSGPPIDGRDDTDLPYALCSGPPYKMRSIRGGALGQGATPEEAAALMVAHPPAGL